MKFVVRDLRHTINPYYTPFYSIQSENPTTMARFSSLPRHLSSTATFHNLRHFSVDRLRNIWISGLIDPEKVTQRERSLLYAGDIEEMHRVRRVNEMYRKEIEESSRKEHIQSKWNKNIRAGVTFFNWKHHKVR